MLDINKNPIKLLQDSIVTLPISSRSSRHDWSKPWPSASALLIERSNSIKTPKRIHKIISNALLQLTISTHKAYRLDGQLFSKTKEALKETCDPTIVTLTWIIWFELPKRSTFSTLGFQHTQIQPLLEWS
jgi:hypothetical protein